MRKLRADRRRWAFNMRLKSAVRKAVTGARRKPKLEAIEKAYSQLDRGAKKGVIHKRKAARLKSRLMKLLKKR